MRHTHTLWVSFALASACAPVGYTGCGSPPSRSSTAAAATSPDEGAHDRSKDRATQTGVPQEAGALGCSADQASSSDGGCVPRAEATCADGTQRVDGGACVVSATPVVEVPGPRDPAAIQAALVGAMRRIRGGSFKMGSEEAGLSEDQGPVHAVTIESFELDVSEVTVEAYAKCVEANACLAPLKERLSTEPAAEAMCNFGHEKRSRQPVNCVSWDDAQRYCKWTGKRLPTEAEWEYAARGRAGRRYPWGKAVPADQLCSRRRSNGISCEVGSFPAGNTPEGISDLAGNVSEWTESVYCPYSEPTCRSTLRAHRGGSFYNDHEVDFRGTERRRAAPGTRHSSIGFRCAR